MQYTLLLASVLSNYCHGPFGSGQNKQSLIEASVSFSQYLAENPDDFDNLVDLILQDRHLSEFDDADENIPDSPEDIPNLKCITNYPVYVS